LRDCLDLSAGTRAHTHTRTHHTHTHGREPCQSVHNEIAYRAVCVRARACVDACVCVCVCMSSASVSVFACTFAFMFACVRAFYSCSWQLCVFCTSHMHLKLTHCRSLTHTHLACVCISRVGVS